MTTTAKINSKGTKGTGITEQLASQLHDNLGRTITAIVELRSESRGENLKGDETVNLAIQTLEVIPEDVGAAEHVRELARVAHYNRKLAEDGPTLPTDDSGPEPTVAEVLAAGAALAPHEFTPIPGDEENCDVCGATEPDSRHDEAVRDFDPTKPLEGVDEPKDPDYSEVSIGEPHIHDPANPAHPGDKNLTSPFIVAT